MVEAPDRPVGLGCPLARTALEMGDVSEAFRERLESSFEVWIGTIAGYLAAHTKAGIRRQVVEEAA